MIPAMNLFPFRRRDSDPGSRCEPKGLLDISWFRECHVRGANVSSRNLDSYPPSVMLFWQGVGWASQVRTFRGHAFVRHQATDGP